MFDGTQPEVPDPGIDFDGNQDEELEREEQDQPSDPKPSQLPDKYRFDLYDQPKIKDLTQEDQARHKDTEKYRGKLRSRLRVDYS